MYILDTKNKRLRFEKELTEQEIQFLGLLCRNRYVEYEDFINYTNTTSRGGVRCTVKRLRNKTPLQIETKNGLGYMLLDKLYIE